MDTNLLKALNNLLKYKTNNLSQIYKSTNRINSVGDALEYYVKDLYCGCLEEPDVNEKEKIHRQYFSYLGNQNNPPDFIIRKGDAIEVKKIQGFGGSLELNSSYPRSKLYATDPMIIDGCRNCEGKDWASKDIVYFVGTIKQNKVRLMFIIYGDCYAADKQVYEKIRDTVIGGVKEIKGIDLSDTNEIGRVNKVDPLGITYLRIRGMWGIEHPLKAFNYIIKDFDQKNNFTAYAIIQKNKYESFPEKDINVLEKSKSSSSIISDIEIKDPNNPAKILLAKLIKVSF